MLPDYEAISKKRRASILSVDMEYVAKTMEVVRKPSRRETYASTFSLRDNDIP